MQWRFNSAKPMKASAYTALENTARDGDSIDNTGSIDLLIGWERTRWKSATALSCRWSNELLSLYSHFNICYADTLQVWLPAHWASSRSATTEMVTEKATFVC